MPLLPTKQANWVDKFSDLFNLAQDLVTEDNI